MNHYLVHLNSGYIHVTGSIRDTQLHWRDPLDGVTGTASKGEYIPHFPREHSKKEKETLWRRKLHG